MYAKGDLWWLCPDGETRTQARIDIPQVMVKLVEAVRTTPEDMQVPKFGRNRRRRVLANATEDFVPQFGDELGGRYSSQRGDR